MESISSNCVSLMKTLQVAEWNVEIELECSRNLVGGGIMWVWVVGSPG